jgi:two-component system OmpR family sensor kinase
MELEQVDLAEVAGELADEFRAVALAGAHPLEVSVADTVAVVGDEQRVVQIGRVLVENALLHTPPGTPVRITIGAEQGRARLSVHDDGPGIPKEHASHVFERFYRVEGGVASGSGLGLAIARELAQLMGGSIELDSRPGRTVFSLVLPLAAYVEPAVERTPVFT